jgi:hypothetical protein
MEQEGPMRQTGFVLAATVCFGLSASAAVLAAAPPSIEACRSRDNNTQSGLLECISEQDLWSNLKVFQKIADENPGLNGHGNRDTGTSGYRASVDYVAKLMRGAGYKVTIQPYVWRHFNLVRRPVFEVAGRSYIPTRDWFVARLSGSGSLAL